MTICGHGQAMTNCQRNGCSHGFSWQVCIGPVNGRNLCSYGSRQERKWKGLVCRLMSQNGLGLCDAQKLSRKNDGEISGAMVCDSVFGAVYSKEYFYILFN